MKYPRKMFSTGLATSASNYQEHYISMSLSLLSDNVSNSLVMHILFIFSIIILPFPDFCPLSKFFFDIPFSLRCHVLVKQSYIIILVITVEITNYTLEFLQFIICVNMCCACVCIHFLMCVCTCAHMYVYLCTGPNLMFNVFLYCFLFCLLRKSLPERGSHQFCVFQAASLLQAPCLYLLRAGSAAC